LDVLWSLLPGCVLTYQEVGFVKALEMFEAAQANKTLEESLKKCGRRPQR
jgi:hypothetical protein